MIDYFFNLRLLWLVIVIILVLQVELKTTLSLWQEEGNSKRLFSHSEKEKKKYTAKQHEVKNEQEMCSGKLPSLVWRQTQELFSALESLLSSNES